jgi:hypothetical protein
MPVLEYASPQSPPPRWRLALYHVRFVLLAFYILLITGVVAYCMANGAAAIVFVIAFLVMLTVQALFLIGMPQLRWPRPTRRKPMWLSLAAGALVAALLTFGLVATALSALDIWYHVTESFGANVVWIIVVSWVLWLTLFAFLWAGQRWLGGFTSLYKTLLAGTWLEILITIPVDVQVRKRTNCWCGEGTFFALVAGGTVAIWTFGPGLAFLFLTRRLQREGYFSLCRKCGHDLTSATTPRCPHCNARIPRYLRVQTTHN